MWLAKVYILYKPDVLDPQGLTVKNALHHLSYPEVEDVRIGKYLEVKLDGSSREEAEKRFQEMCIRLLVNPVIETYYYNLEEIK
jgi:phosphoribosylformylglycinamidine synthase